MLDAEVPPRLRLVHRKFASAAAVERCGEERSLVARPAQLVHYILRRLRTYRQRVWAMDEMDLWMRYLSQGLWWEDDAIEDRMVEVLSHTDALDAWAYGERGLRPKTKRLRQRLDRGTRALLDAIADTGSDGRLEAQLMLLEMSRDARKPIAGELRRAAQLGLEESRQLLAGVP